MSAVDPSVRSKRQRNTVMKIVNRADFDFACGNPFEVDLNGYCGKFTFTYYRKGNKLCFATIDELGRIIQHVGSESSSTSVLTVCLWADCQEMDKSNKL